MNAYTKALKKGFEWVVVANYDHANFKAGDIISRHKTFEAALKAACKEYPSFRAVRDTRSCAD